MIVNIVTLDIQYFSYTEILYQNAINLNRERTTVEIE